MLPAIGELEEEVESSENEINGIREAKGQRYFWR